MTTSKPASYASLVPLAPFTCPRPKRSEKSGYLAIGQIADLIARAVVNEHQLLKTSSSSQIYATDCDAFEEKVLDLTAHQSVNTNPSTPKGVCL